MTQPVQVVAVGGTVPAAMLTVIGELSRRPGLAIIASCPQLGIRDLRSACASQVIELADREPLVADRVYLLPPGLGVSISEQQLVVGAAERAQFDLLLRSIATEIGGDGVGIILAGTGTDGTIGIKRLKEEGGLIVAQRAEGEDAELPVAAIETGLVDLVAPLAHIASEVGSLIAHPTLAPTEAEDEPLLDILALLRTQTGHDFSSYKRATLHRRIARRMQVHGCVTLGAYERFLRDHVQELEHLLRDFLISVTNFFRDPEVFAMLATEVIPRLFAGKKPSDQVRVWVAGCATGEEAYSLGMLLLEYAGTLRAPPSLQIFATDIDEHALAEARTGAYLETIAADVSADRLARFFVHEGSKYRVAKELRDIVLFSPHNVLRDPPFSRLDLVSCRNLLIYLDRDAQLRVLSMFHFGLRLDGVLVLGSSEAAESGAAMFSALDAKCHVFARRMTPASTIDGAVAALPRWQRQHVPLPTLPSRERATSLGELHYRLVEYYAPPSALLDASLDLIHLSESAGKFFELTGGEPTRQALRIVIAPLRLELRTAIYSARQHGSAVRTVRYDEDGMTKQVELRVRAVELPELAQGAMLVMFDQGPSTEITTPPPSSGSAIEPVVREIEEQLHRTRDQLRTTIEQYETSLEELKASNEELQAMNEELRSATEELETSKEEIQSVNEELTTLNGELEGKVEEISSANSDLQNLMTSTEIGVVFLDRKLNIKRFTPRVVDVFNIIPSDLGRPLAHLTHRLQCDDLAEIARGVLETLRGVDKNVTTTDGRSYLIRWLPYRSIQDRIDGVVITFVDVSELRDAVDARRRSETALAQVEERLRVALRTAPVAVLGFDANAALTWAYSGGREHTPPSLDDILSAEHGEELRAIVREIAVHREGRRAELAVKVGGESRVYDFRIEPAPAGVTAVGFDITPSKLAEASLRDADRRKDEFLATLSHELRNPLTPLRIAIDVARLVDHDPERRAASLAVMENQVGMLSELVDELLDLSRITQGKLDLQRELVDVRHVLERAVEASAAMFSDNRHRLALDLPPGPIHVMGDARRLVQIFTNLLVNAAKYTPPEGRIEVGAKIEPLGHKVAIRVVDTGIGISEDAMKNIFDIFVQSRDVLGRSQGGLGIGLNVVHRLVALHGGAVSARSDGLGKGSVFTVELPLESAQ